MGWPRLAGSSIQRRIFSAFVALVTLVLAMGVAGQWQLRQVAQVSQEILPQGQRTHRLQEIGASLGSLETDAERLMVVGDPAIRDKVRDDLALIERALARLPEDASGPAAAQAALVAQVAQLRDRLGRFAAPPASPRQRNEDMLAVYGALQQAKQSLRDASLDTQLRLQRAVTRQTVIIGNLTLQFLLASALVFVVALTAALFISRSIAAPVAEVARAAQQVADGQLGARARVSSDDEIGLLAERFNLMTARLQATLEGLRRSEADYRGIYANALEGIWRVNLEGRVVSANPAMAQLLGYDSPAELLAQVTDIRRQVYLHGEERDRALPELLRRGVLPGRELQFRRKDGQVIWVSTNTRVECDESGKPLYLEGFVTDITERKRAEQELRRHRDNLEEMVAARTAELTAEKERAEVASRAKSVFLASMSHELRTPLNAVLGYARILQHDPALVEPQRGRVECIEQAGDHLLMLINEVLDLAKIEAGKLELQSDAIELPRFVGMVGDLARVKAEQKGLRFVCNEAAALPACVKGDERRLRQVLLNLLDNAVKFTERGEVMLRVSRPQPGVLRFDVEDTGCGIAADNLELIFQPFEQVGTALLRPGGTGLGLSISRQLVEKMGGRLQVASQPGQGSCFWFELPVHTIDATPAEAPAPRRIVGYDGARKRLLVVDDIAANRQLMIDWLAPLGFELDEAGDGQQALARAAEQRPDLVLMDCVMPVLDGLEATRRLRTMPGLHDVPVIAISAAALPDDERRSLDAGVSVFVRKPVDLDALLEHIGELLALRWLEDDAPGDTAEAPAEPPLVAPRHEEMIVLHRLAQRGNMREIREFAERLAEREPAVRPFAQRLLRLADAYQPTAILRLVTAHLR